MHFTTVQRVGKMQKKLQNETKAITETTTKKSETITVVTETPYHSEKQNH